MIIQSSVLLFGMYTDNFKQLLKKFKNAQYAQFLAHEWYQSHYPPSENNHIKLNIRDKLFISSIVLAMKQTLNTSKKVNLVHLWGTENAQETVEHTLDLLKKMSIFFTISVNKIFRLFEGLLSGT